MGFTTKFLFCGVRLKHARYCSNMMVINGSFRSGSVSEFSRLILVPAGLFAENCTNIRQLKKSVACFCQVIAYFC